MLTKNNIMDEISKLKQRKCKLTLELAKDYSETVNEMLKRELVNLNDNLYRLELQAKNWGLMK